MYALTIQQPWASAIMAGVKTIENRTWGTEHRGPLAIHAGRKIDPQGLDILRAAGVDLDALFDPPQRASRLIGPQDLPRGAILGHVVLIDVVRYPTPTERRAAQGGFSWAVPQYSLLEDPLAFGPFCWILREPRILPKPIPCAGHQGLWYDRGIRSFSYARERTLAKARGAKGIGDAGPPGSGGTRRLSESEPG